MGFDAQCDDASGERQSRLTLVVEEPPPTLGQSHPSWVDGNEVPPCAAADGGLPARCPGWCEYARPARKPPSEPCPVDTGAVVGGAYTLGRVIGRGGMGVVYQAHDRRLGRTVAVKLLSEEHALSGSLVGRFESEVRAMAQVRHPNLVELIDWGTHRGLPYLVMGYVAGGNLLTLLERIPSKRLGVFRSLMILQAACAGVAALHRAKIVHNDIKASNVFLASDGTGVVGDLGMARPCAPCCRTPLGRVEGTPGYVAPELASGVQTRPSPSADVYALGVLAFRLLAGRLPFEGDSAPELFHHHLATTPPAPSKFRPKLHPRLDEIVLWSLAKDPSKRPRDAARLGLALRDFVGP